MHSTNAGRAQIEHDLRNRYMVASELVHVQANQIAGYASTAADIAVQHAAVQELVKLAGMLLEITSTAHAMVQP